MIILDTCVISEFIKPDPAPAVLAWLDQLPEDQVFMPALVLAELQRGVARLPASQKKSALELWLEQLESRFAGRIPSFDATVARCWGHLQARLEAQGRPLPLMDSLVAATALAHHAILATRNTADFQGVDIELMNPWV